MHLEHMLTYDLCSSQLLCCILPGERFSAFPRLPSDSGIWSSAFSNAVHHEILDLPQQNIPV